MGHIERKLRDKENTKKNILKAALDIANAEGWPAVTIRRISEAIEYTTSIVYGHFESKEALLLALVDQGFGQLYAITTDALKATDSPKEQLLAISVANWDYALANREMYQLMFSIRRPSGNAAFKGMDLIENIFERLTGKKGQENQSFFLNWICLRRGCINLLMEFKDHEDVANPRDLYIEFMERFIDSIALK